MSDIGFWDVIIWTFWLMILATWLAMAFLIVREVLSDGAMNGAAKAVWIMFVILVPWLGAADVHLHARARHKPTVCAAGSRQRAGPSFVNLERASDSQEPTRESRLLEPPPDPPPHGDERRCSHEGGRGREPERSESSSRPRRTRCAAAGRPAYHLTGAGPRAL